MNNPIDWLSKFSVATNLAGIDGLVPVQGYVKTARPPEEVETMEKAAHYRADAVFFEAPRHGKAPIAQAFIYRSNGPVEDLDFAELHQRLWSWGGVPLVYRFTSGLVQLFRCAHRPDFEKAGEIVFRPFDTLKLTSKIATNPWWDAERLRTGALWDDPLVCKQLLSSTKAAQKTLINEVKGLHDELNEKDILPKSLRRRLLILSVLIAYLEKRGVFEDGFFARFRPGADKFFRCLQTGRPLSIYSITWKSGSMETYLPYPVRIANGFTAETNSPIMLGWSRGGRNRVVSLLSGSDILLLTCQWNSLAISINFSLKMRRRRSIPPFCCPSNAW